MYYPCNPSATFERRVRALVWGLQRLHPGMSRDRAMERARQVPPKRLGEAIRKLNNVSSKSNIGTRVATAPRQRAER